MDKLISLYTTTDGRISRKQWWLGGLGLIVASIVLSFILSLVGFSAWVGVPTIDPANPDVEAISAALIDGMRKGAWAGLIMFLILAYPSYCLSMKRRHDRDNPGRDVQICFVLNIVILLIPALGLSLTNVDAGNGLTIPAPALWYSILSFALGIFGLYLLVVLGFLRGTAGTNSYGADPVLGAAATA